MSGGHSSCVPRRRGGRFPLLLLLAVTLASPTCQVLSLPRTAAILDDQTVWGHSGCLALTLAREQINGIIEVPAKARVEVDIFELQQDSQQRTMDTMCQILPKGVVSVLGPPSSPTSASTVSQICGEKEIPHIKAGPEEMPHLWYLHFASVSLYPNNKDTSLAISQIPKFFNYPSSSLICAKAECLLRLEEPVRGFLISKETLSVRMLDDSWDPTPLLKELHNDQSVHHPHGHQRNRLPPRSQYRLGAGNDLRVLQVHPRHQGLAHSAPGWGGGLLQYPGLLQVQHLATLLSQICAQPQSVLEGELRSQPLPRPRGELAPYPQLADTSGAPSGLGGSCSEPLVSLLLSEYIQEASQCGWD